MADFPTALKMSQGTRALPSEGRTIEVAVDGTVRGRTMYAATVYEISVVMRYMSPADRTTLITHYDAEKDNQVTVKIPDGDGGTVDYLANFANRPRFERVAGTNRWHGEVKLWGTLAP